MKLLHCLLLAFAFLMVTPGIAAPTSAPTPPTYERMSLKGIKCDKLVLFDLGDLPFAKIIKADDQVWVLAQITRNLEKHPSFGSNYDPVIQKYVPIPMTDPTSTVWGRVEVKAALAQKSVPSEDYKVSFPVVGSGTEVSQPRISYSPFNVGGYAICHIDPKAEGRDRYSPLYVVPAEWQAFVVPAFAFCRANPALFSDSDSDTHMTAARRTRLTALLASPNPYLAAFACRTLTRAAAVDPETADMALSQPDPFRQAAMTYLLLANVPQQDNATATVVEGSIHAVTNDAGTLDSLNGIALGIGAALESAGGSATWGARDDLAEVRKRLAPDGAADSYVSALLQGYERTDK